MKFTVKEVMIIVQCLEYNKIRNKAIMPEEDMLLFEKLIKKFQNEMVGETKIKKVKVYRNGTK